MIKLINRGKYEVSVLEEFEHFAQTTTSFLSQIFDALGTPVPAPAQEAGEQLGQFPPSAHHKTHEPGGVDALMDLDGSVISSGVVADARLGHNVLKVTGGFTGSTSDFLRADGTFAPAAGGGGTPDPHHATHEPGGSDAILNLDGGVITSGALDDARLSVNVLTAAGGYPGGTSAFLRADGSFAAPPTPPVTGDVFGPAGAMDTQVARFDGATGKIIKASNVTIDDSGILVAAGLGGTPLNATQLTSGTVPDARLSANVALKDASNVFTAIQKNEGPFGLIYQADRSAPAGQQAWGTTANGNFYQIQALNDSYGFVSTPLSVDRSGNLTIQGF